MASESKFGTTNFDPEKERELENGGQPRRLSRIAPPPSASISGDVDKDVSLQVQMEEGNAIKYRTCSWQKVKPAPIS